MIEPNKSDTVVYHRNGVSCERRKRREYSEEFKHQIVDLCKAGKRRVDLMSEYDLTESTLGRWLREDANSGSFRAQDNRTPEENEVRRLQKEIKQLQMENDILKKAALIFGNNQKQN